MTPLDPARMMLGRDFKLPVDLCFGRPEEEPIETTSDYVATLQKKLERIHHFACEHLNLMSEYMKQNYDLSLRCPQLKTRNGVCSTIPSARKALVQSLNANAKIYHQQEAQWPGL